MVFTGFKNTPLDKTIQILKAKLDALVKDKNNNLQDGEVIKLSQHIDRLVVMVMNRQREESCPECGANMVHEGGCTSCYSCGFAKCG